jgi:hypothetical protein
VLSNAVVVACIVSCLTEEPRNQAPDQPIHQLIYQPTATNRQPPAREMMDTIEGAVNKVYRDAESGGSGGGGKTGGSGGGGKRGGGGGAKGKGSGEWDAGGERVLERVQTVSVDACSRHSTSCRETEGRMQQRVLSQPAASQPTAPNQPPPHQPHQPPPPAAALSYIRIDGSTASTKRFDYTNQFQEDAGCRVGWVRVGWGRLGSVFWIRLSEGVEPFGWMCICVKAAVSFLCRETSPASKRATNQPPTAFQPPPAARWPSSRPTRPASASPSTPPAPSCLPS